MLPAYKCSQPVKGFILVSARTVFLAPEVHFPLLAPVTPNNAKPFKFWIEVIPRCSDIIWDFPLFPTKPQNGGGENCITQEGEHLMLPLGWDMACFWWCTGHLKVLQGYSYVIWWTHTCSLRRPQVRPYILQSNTCSPRIITEKKWGISFY